jgi:hypothetical protein
MIKRAPGGGRKPKGGFSQLSSTLTIRIPDDMRKQLESEAAEKNESMAQRLMWHLRQSFNREVDKQRDPALQGLLYMIGQLAERLSAGMYMAAGPVRSDRQRWWRTDLFRFRAFKVAVKKLFDAIEEPSWGSRPPTEKEVRDDLKKWSTDPEFLKEWLEAYKSAESFGAKAFTDFWSDVARSREPFTEADYQAMREVEVLYPDHPNYSSEMERENYNLRKASKALELKPKSKSEKPKDKADD